MQILLPKPIRNAVTFWNSHCLRLVSSVAALLPALLLIQLCPKPAAIGSDDTGAAQEVELKPHPDAAANTHKPGEVDRPELVPFIVKDARRLPGIILDETDAVLTGKWQYSTHTPPYVGIGYLHDRKSDKGKCSVTYTPDLPIAGVYEVRMSHCYNIRRSTNTPVTIHHADGEKTIRINQQLVPEYGKLFRSLGRFRFEAGRKGWVRISTEGTDGKYVITDAVQFLRPDEFRKLRK